jgi:hypothetical protein
MRISGMRSLRAAGAIATFCLAFTLTIGGLATRAEAQVCHDGSWDWGEFCGFDAFQVTGVTEMNHDCTVDFLDFSLFVQDFGLNGPNRSGDFDNSGVVGFADFLTFVSSYGATASPCVKSGILCFFSLNGVVIEGF